MVTLFVLNCKINNIMNVLSPNSANKIRINVCNIEDKKPISKLFSL